MPKAKSTAPSVGSVVTLPTFAPLSTLGAHRDGRLPPGRYAVVGDRPNPASAVDYTVTREAAAVLVGTFGASVETFDAPEDADAASADAAPADG